MTILTIFFYEINFFIHRKFPSVEGYKNDYFLKNYVSELKFNFIQRIKYLWLSVNQKDLNSNFMLPEGLRTLPRLGHHIHLRNFIFIIIISPKAFLKRYIVPDCLLPVHITPYSVLQYTISWSPDKIHQSIADHEENI